MPAWPCANHPGEQTFVRCGRCEKPICVRCMVDTPVGKRCRECSSNKTHLSESTPLQVARAGVGALLAALVSAGMVAQLGYLIVLLPIYGYVVGEAALWAGQRRRSRAIEVVTGLSALLGGVATGIGPWGAGVGPEMLATAMWPFLLGVVGAAVAVGRIRYL